MQSISNGYFFLSLYQVYPSYHGASEISLNFFEYWPDKNKKFLQISNSSKKQDKIFNLRKRKNLFGTLINLILAVREAKKYLSNYKNKYIIIEGASWAGYIFTFIIFSKLFISNVKIVYHAHNLEYEVRKLKNSKFISYLTFFFEKYIYKNTFGTTVSKKDYLFVKNIYNQKSIIFENGVSEIKDKKIINNKITKKNFLLFCGSYTYWPNKVAIDKIYKQRNIIKKIFPNIKFLITGEGCPNFQDKNFINLKIIKKNNLIWLIKNCLFFYAPLPKAPGTKIKILEALYYGAKTVCSNYSLTGIKKIEGINNLFVTTDANLSKTLEKMKINNNIKKNNEFKKYYNFNKKVVNFYEKNFSDNFKR
tara:strand:+ start:2894 stop:3982 length:1089 start_codon:yes stop_codon:yes gene_type:complete